MVKAFALALSTMWSSTSYLLSLVPFFVLIAAQDDGNSSANAAGYDTSRVGPSNANCQRESYQLNITSDNVQFQNVDPNANSVSDDFLLVATNAHDLTT